MSLGIVCPHSTVSRVCHHCNPWPRGPCSLCSAAHTRYLSPVFIGAVTCPCERGLSGGKLIRQISKTWPQTRTLLMSAHPLVTQLAQECGADAVFRKGEPVVQLLACIAGLVPTTITPGCCAS